MSKVTLKTAGSCCNKRREQDYNASFFKFVGIMLFYSVVDPNDLFRSGGDIESEADLPKYSGFGSEPKKSAIN
jgi:hypothetical protein